MAESDEEESEEDMNRRMQKDFKLSHEPTWLSGQLLYISIFILLGTDT